MIVRLSGKSLADGIYFSFRNFLFFVFVSFSSAHELLQQMIVAADRITAAENEAMSKLVK